jgi:hypothetical protein
MTNGVQTIEGWLGLPWYSRWFQGVLAVKVDDA